jgi:hypothetical protein
MQTQQDIRMNVSRFVSAGVVAACAGLAVAGGPNFSTTLGDPGVDGSNMAAFIEYDDGTGESLYAIGQFTIPGNPDGTNIARWDGSAWTNVGGGLQDSFSNVLEVYQGNLIAAGYFNSAGNVPGSAKLARWDGTNWNSMDAQSESFLNSFWDLAVWDDGITGEQLYIAGNYRRPERAGRARTTSRSGTGRRTPRSAGRSAARCR